MAEQTVLLILIPILVGGVTQVMKGIVKSWRAKELRLKYLFDYGDFPSTHTSFVISVVTVIGFHEGISSTIFFLAVALAVIIIRDAWSFRRKVSRYGEVLNNLRPTLSKKQHDAIHGVRIEERLGHNFYEIFGGAVFGFFLSWLFYWILLQLI
ncbi:divergent PAP2 family protein [Patescibacteria group bacterium]